MMEIVISGLALVKFFLFLAISGFWAFICLFPVSDQPTTKGQWVFYCITEVLILCLMFGLFQLPSRRLDNKWVWAYNTVIV